MVILAREEHIAGVHGLLQACGRHLSAVGIQQWETSYPDLETIRADVAAGEAYVILEGARVAGCITINETQDPQYANIDWKYKEPALVVHRLGVHPDFQGKAFAHQLMTFGEDFARKNGYASIRLDAYVGNPRSQAFYRRRGYEACGFVKFDYQLLDCTCFEYHLHQA